ncbi:M56 family metallopeptidase [Neptunicella sp.]|uniref:M56 family metallopeptidase n=1 Tax=Neptunicella sp. TaxID=2125986 RepID=UPI003F690E61
MASWILSQQLVLSVILLLMLLLERKAVEDLGARTVYLLWLLVPLALLVNNLPVDLVSLNNHSINRYVVGFSSQSQKVGSLFSWQFIWMIGALAVMAVAWWQQWRFSQLSLTPLKNIELPTHFPQQLIISTSRYVAGPVLTGIFRPRLIVPSSFQADFTAAQQQMILQHELVHYRRRDNVFNLCGLVVVALFWFNPLVWIGYKAFRRCQELACDEVVLINKNQQEKILYSKALLRCAEVSLQPMTIYSQYGDKHSMKKRIKLIQHSGSAKVSLVATVLMLSGGLLTGIAMANQQPATIDKTQVNLASPVQRVEPLYPLEAAEQKIEGSVVLQFDIDVDGTTSNIKVIKAIPEQVFEKESIKALQQWRYKPRIVGGQAQKQTNLLVQLDYLLDQTSSPRNSLVEGIKIVN